MAMIRVVVGLAPRMHRARGAVGATHRAAGGRRVFVTGRSAQRRGFMRRATVLRDKRQEHSHLENEPGHRPKTHVSPQRCHDALDSLPNRGERGNQHVVAPARTGVSLEPRPSTNVYREPQGRPIEKPARRAKPEYTVSCLRSKDPICEPGRSLCPRKNSWVLDGIRHWVLTAA